MKPILAKVAELPPPAPTTLPAGVIEEEDDVALSEEEVIRRRMEAHEYVDAELNIIDTGLRIVSHLGEKDERRDRVLDAAIQAWLNIVQA
jgi:hypothetical protein